MKRIRNCIVLVLLLSMILSMFAGCQHNADPEVTYADTDLFWKSPSVSQVVYVVDTANISTPEVEMLVSLQGIVAKTEASIYLKNGQESSDWLTLLKEKHGILVQEVSSAWDLVDMYTEMQMEQMRMHSAAKPPA